MILKSPQSLTLFLTTTRGVAQSEWVTFSSTCSFSSLSSSAPTTGFRAKGSFLTLQYLGSAPSRNDSVALNVLQHPSCDLNNASFILIISCKLTFGVLVTATLQN